MIACCRTLLLVMIFENIALDDVVLSNGQLDLESCRSINTFNKMPVSVRYFVMVIVIVIVLQPTQK